MTKIIALLFAVLLASPALAMNELQGQTLAKVEEMSKTHGVIVEKLSEADTAALDAGTNPRPKPSVVYQLTLGSTVIIALVHEEVVVFSSNPIELETINKMLGRSGA